MPGGGFRLPTEVEWEYACRAGTETPFWFGEQITSEQVNYGNREQTMERIKALPCNGWGLYQMHGNVWEWCQDGYGNYPADTVIDPAGPVTGERRVLRGGSWINLGRHTRSAYRNRLIPGYRSLNSGFRLARDRADITVEMEDTIIVTDRLEEPVEIKASRAEQTLRSSVGQALRRLWERIKP